MSMLLGSDFTLATTDKLAEAIQKPNAKPKGSVKPWRSSTKIMWSLKSMSTGAVSASSNIQKNFVPCWWVDHVKDDTTTNPSVGMQEEATASNCVQCNEGIWVINAISESLRWAERSQEDRMPVPLQEDIPANAIEEDSEEHSEEDQLRQAWEVLNEHKLDHYVFSENRAAELEYDRWTILQFRTEAVLMYYGLMDREK
ncbi:hypothetical protein SERLA73DRAFT_156417 [Serpula lacrymans var. lacrymans S7.3]|uniref:Uncharacterized protein n=1 Tax=Serpula lacrymans var. lacrymans (strain S7.3) TaxID=936435 RepID=F8QED4_SERL3|nr:hypothetical protein SERLA73DRAFT_156417 [Serpula lacrymans var. lacrymans S7.3]